MCICTLNGMYANKHTYITYACVGLLIRSYIRIYVSMCVPMSAHSHRQSGKLAVRHQNVCNTDIHAHRQHFMNTRKQQIKCVCMYLIKTTVRHALTQSA